MYIKEFPSDKYRFEFYVNYGKKTFQQIKREKNCDVIINTWFYDMAKYTNAKTSYAIEASTDCGVVIDGREIGKVVYNEYGICIDDKGNLFCATQSGQKNYAIGLPVQYKGGQRYPNNTSLPKNGCTHIGFKADGTPVLALVSKDKPMTNDELNTAMLKFGCVDILRFDGSWSSQGDLDGIVVQPSQVRIVQGYLLAFKRNEEKQSERKFRVCLDPGHGTGEMNQSPDGSYIEHKFTLDIANRIRTHLFRCGVDVKLTREDSSTPSLTERANIANKYGADLFVSLHSNAVSGGWNNDVNGLTVWTYASGGERDRAAKLLLAETKQAGVKTFGTELYHSKFTVLAKTVMPAYLIEYAFHTSHSDVKLLLDTQHRDKLATATAKAICAWGHVKWVDVPTAPTVPSDGFIYRVQVGAFNVHDNAVKLQQELENKGYKPFIVKEVKA